jgi:hypothetical protein
MRGETRDAIQSYEHPHSREFCIDFLKSRQFYTLCTYIEVHTLLIVLGKDRTLSNFQNLFY